MAQFREYVLSEVDENDLNEYLKLDDPQIFEFNEKYQYNLLEPQDVDNLNIIQVKKILKNNFNHKFSGNEGADKLKPELKKNIKDNFKKDYKIKNNNDDNNDDKVDDVDDVEEYIKHDLGNLTEEEGKWITAIHRRLYLINDAFEKYDPGIVDYLLHELKKGKFKPKDLNDKIDQLIMTSPKKYHKNYVNDPNTPERHINPKQLDYNSDVDDEEDNNQMHDNHEKNDGKHGKGIGDNSGLWSDEINKIMQSYAKKGFKGTFSIDEIGNVPINPNDKNISFIMNTTPSYVKKSGHWIAVMLTPDNLEYYDSFADEPSKEFLQNIKPLSYKWAPNKLLQFKINSVKKQNANSNNCGYFAILFLENR